jgi:hypothetical protein
MQRPSYPIDEASLIRLQSQSDILSHLSKLPLRHAALEYRPGVESLIFTMRLPLRRFLDVELIETLIGEIPDSYFRCECPRFIIISISRVYCNLSIFSNRRRDGLGWQRFEVFVVVCQMLVHIYVEN